MRRIEAAGEIDIVTVPALLRAVDGAIDDDPGGLVEVDFGNVSFVDSTGLGCLGAGQRRARSLGGDLTVVGVPDALRRVFELTLFDDLLAA